MIVVVNLYSCILSAENAYVFWCANVLPLCVDVCANVVIVTRLVISYCQARRKHCDADKPTHINASVHRVRI